MKTLFVILFLLLSQIGLTQNRCEYVLLQQFFYHLEAEKPENIKEYACKTYLSQNIGETEMENISPCIFDANQHALKHNSTCTFNRYGELVKLVCSDPEGNIWEERAYYSNNKCTRIYISKNENIESMYKICYDNDNKPMISRQIVRTDIENAYPAINPRVFGTGITYSLPYEASTDNIIVSPDNFFYSHDDAYYLYTFIVTPPENVQMKYNIDGDWTEIVWHNDSDQEEYITERAIAYYDNSKKD